MSTTAPAYSPEQLVAAEAAIRRVAKRLGWYMPNCTALAGAALEAASVEVDDATVERGARAANLDAGRQRGFTFEDDWDTLTEQERGGWRNVARAVLVAALSTSDSRTEGSE